MAILLPEVRASSTKDDALAHLFRRARNNRHDALAQHDYGFALLTSERIGESIEWLERAVMLDSLEPAYHTNLSAALHQTGNWAGGFYHARKAYELDISSPLAAINVASFHYWMGETYDAAEWYEKAITLDPTIWKAWWMWIFMRDFLPITAEEALSDRKRFAAACEQPLKKFWADHPNDLDPERKLRLGLTGGDFRQHSSSYCWGPIFEHLDRDRFEIYSYAHLEKTDALTDWFKRGSEAWRDVTQCFSDRVLAEQIRRDKIDVLIDLGTFSDNSHLMAHLYKPAPVSMTAWGHLTGTGLECMDGLLVDRIMVPEDRQWEMTEQPAYVPHAMGWYRPRELPPLLPRPERPLTFGYLGRIQKLCDKTVSLWADLLHEYPSSRLLLKDVAYDHERAATRTLERFESWGVDPRRITLKGLSGRDEHLACWREVDVGLDPLPQSGGATTMEGLMMGVPTVTLRGERLVRRVSASTVTVAGHPEWVADSIHQYVEIAGRIATEGGQALRDQFLASHICDGAARTRAFEEAIRGLWKAYAGRKHKERDRG